jgi:hypothetical protein
MKMLCSFETSQYIKLPATQCVIPEDQNPQDVQYKELKINMKNKTNM